MPPGCVAFLDKDLGHCLRKLPCQLTFCFAQSAYGFDQRFLKYIDFRMYNKNNSKNNILKNSMLCIYSSMSYIKNKSKKIEQMMYFPVQ